MQVRSLRPPPRTAPHARSASAGPRRGHWGRSIARGGGGHPGSTAPGMQAMQRSLDRLADRS